MGRSKRKNKSALTNNKKPKPKIIEENLNQDALDLKDIERIFSEMIIGYTNNAEFIYHYTTLEALLGGIIPEDSNAKLCFRATNIEYMNDPQEMKINVEKLKEDINIERLNNYYDRITPEIIDAKNKFIISFSENRDTLPMWSMYGKNGNGVLLEFKRSELDIEKYPLIKCIYQGSDMYHQIIKIIRAVLDDNNSFTKAKFYLLMDKGEYPNDTFDNRKKRIRPKPNTGDECNCDCEKLFTELIKFLATNLYPIATYKHSAYEFEKELRLIFNESDINKVKYRHRDGMLVPFIDRYIERNALNSIIIGPTQEVERSKNSLGMFLKARGFDNVEIKQSTIPYRN